MAEGTPRGTASATVLVVSGMLHARGKNQGRICPMCGARWTMEYQSQSPPRVFRDDKECPEDLLDWVGNNAAIECCSSRGRGR